MLAMSSSSSSAAAAGAGAQAPPAPPPPPAAAPRLRASRIAKRVRPLGDLSLADVVASTIEQFIAFDQPAATCLIFTKAEDASEDGALHLALTLERRTGMLAEATVSEGDAPLECPRFAVKEFVERICVVTSDEVPTDEAVRAARRAAMDVLDKWQPFTSVEARGAHEAVVGTKPATETWREGALLRTTAVRRRRAEDAEFGAFDDEELDEEDESALRVTVSERRTRDLFVSVSVNEVKRSLQARAKMLRTPRQLPVSYDEEGALKASSGVFTLTFPGPGGGVEPSAHPRIDAFFAAFS